MNNRELFLLNPYRLPTQHTLMLSGDDVCVFLNGYLSLWHPAALQGAVRPPQVASPYDHEQPKADCLYAVSESPPLFLPEDWEQRVKQARAQSYSATADRRDTFEQMLQAIGAGPGDPTRNAMFIGLGLGYLVHEALCEAMDHLNQLSVEDFWRDVQQAVQCEDLDSCRGHLVHAAEKLREARRVLYDSTTHLLDLFVLEEQPAREPLPVALEYGSAINLVASAQVLETLARQQPDRFDLLREAVKSGHAEIASGPLLERPDALLPVESQLWNLRHGHEVYRRLFGQDLSTFGRRRFGATPHLPQFLHAVGIKQALLLALDEGVLPQFYSAAVEWYSPSGEQVKAFTRKPHPADSPLTYFHLAHYLSKTMQQDMVSSLALLHRDKPPAPWYRDWLELHRLAPVFVQAATLGNFFNEAGHGEYSPPRSADDFHSDYLHELVESKSANPVSFFADWVRQRRRLDDVLALAALLHSVADAGQLKQSLPDLQGLEKRLELEEGGIAQGLAEAESRFAAALADRLVARADQTTPGFLLVNPCSFPRLMCVTLDGVQTPLPAPAKATQLDGSKAKAVIEVPALGFSWVPTAVAPGTRVAMPRGKLAEDRIVRNEFIEAEIDGATGGLRTLRSPRKPAGRLGQQLIFGPGSTMRVAEVRVTSSGPALGEIITEGELVDSNQNVLARYRQEYRVWWARPVLELAIAIEPKEPPVGYPWHAFYGVRFAWREPRTALARGVNFESCSTTHTRPETIEFIELRNGPERTAILTGGLPFLQRQGNRMLDVVLIPEGEKRREFNLAIVLDAEDPQIAARAFISQPIVVPVQKGPPHVGTSGWLFHVDATNVLINSLRPAEAGAAAVTARLVEIRGVGTAATLRCPRNPVRAAIINEFGIVLGELPINGDGVELNFSALEMKLVRIHFS